MVPHSAKSPEKYFLPCSPYNLPQTTLGVGGIWLDHQRDTQGTDLIWAQTLPLDGGKCAS